MEITEEPHIPILPQQSITQIIDEKLQYLSNQTNHHLPSIFKVHRELRRKNPEAYTPVLVSIGPYHHQNPDLQETEKLKLSYLHFFLTRTGENTVRRYVTALEELKDDILSCYANVTSRENPNTDLFLEMLLLDGCFIVEFIRRYSKFDHDVSGDPMFNVAWMTSQVCRDLLLLENQVPYFVLTKLYDLNEVYAVDRKKPFKDLAFIAFMSKFPKAFALSSNAQIEEGGIKHLLHLVHIFCQSCSWKGNSISGNVVLDQIHCVKKLEEAGIKFKKVRYPVIDPSYPNSLEDRVGLLDIKFSNGLMEIPSFKVDDTTEPFLRNLIAYEQHSSDMKTKYFTDYVAFMSQLINTDQDVNVLRRNGIIESLLGDDGEVVNMFNKLGDGVITSPKFYYSVTCQNVNQHCQKMRNVVMAKLRRDYFNNPWASVSTFAAALMIFLTMAQTIASFLQLRQ